MEGSSEPGGLSFTACSLTVSLRLRCLAALAAAAPAGGASPCCDPAASFPAPWRLLLPAGVAVAVVMVPASEQPGSWEQGLRGVEGF